MKFDQAAILNNKVTVEKQETDKLGKLWSRKVCEQKWLATLCLSGGRMCITYYVRAMG